MFAGTHHIQRGPLIRNKKSLCLVRLYRTKICMKNVWKNKIYKAATRKNYFIKIRSIAESSWPERNGEPKFQLYSSQGCVAQILPYTGA
jgi:hypothetical protein